MDVFKILKFRTPISLHSLYTISRRTDTTLITPFPSPHFLYQSASIWNTIRPKLDINDFSVSLGSVKANLKKTIFHNQHQHDMIEWLTSHDFDAGKLIKAQFINNKTKSLKFTPWWCPHSTIKIKALRVLDSPVYTRNILRFTGFAPCCWLCKLSTVWVCRLEYIQYITIIFFYVVKI